MACVLEVCIEEYREHSLEAAAALICLAMSYSKLGNYAEALPLMQQVYDIRKELLGEEHPETQKAKELLAEFRRHVEGQA